MSALTFSSSDRDSDTLVESPAFLESQPVKRDEISTV
eukprot:COSAG05_NODE_21836_length_269_cov_0.594118_1_plen_36_part_01